MPYRTEPSALSEPASVAPDGSLVTLDVSGAPGADGMHGLPGADGAYHGADGGRGGDAGPAAIGQSAGMISVHLAAHPSLGDERLVLSGDLVLAGGQRRRVEREVPFREGGCLDLVALGGTGGDGGDGGRGGSGARGTRGRDATRYSNGGSGGRGGDGGDGGDGTSGASGGAGGRVQVEVAAEDTHLVMLLRTEVRGGGGGRAGRNGSGGSGGAGGPGGSSHSWIETEHYTDSQGKRQTRTVYRSRSGGSSGPSGSSGRSGRAPLHHGSPGPDGHFEIIVRDRAGHAVRYTDRYRLRLVSFEHVNENDDGIYEPGERVEVRRVRVANVGGMPTPSHHEVRVVLDSDGWVWPEPGEHLVVPPALGPGDIAEVPGGLFFRIGEHEPTEPGDAFQAEDYIGQTAFLPSVNRAFGGYRPQRDEAARYVVRYPLEISIIESLPAIAPGEAARVRFAVRNVSRRAFGASSSLGRVIRLRLTVHESELEPQHLALFDERDRPVDVERGWILDVDRLEPGEVRTFEGTIGMSADAPFFHAVTFRLALELGRIDEPTRPRPIQYRAFTARVARRYRRVPGAELLLVVNHRTTREQIAAWERLADRLGLRMTTWDPAIEGHLDPCRDDGVGPLVQHFAGGTVAVLDAPVPTPAGEVRPHRVLDRSRLRALVDAGISTLVLGGAEGSVDLVRWLVPDEGGEPRARHADAAGFRAALAARREDDEPDADAVHASIEIHHVGFWFEPPTAERLKKRAEALSAHLRDAYPHRRFIVFTEHAPELVSSVGLAKRWRLGTLRVQSTLGSARTHVVHVGGALGDARPETLDGDARSAEVLLLARSFDEKLSRLTSVVRAKRDASAEVRALLVDLATEQAAVLASGWRRGLSRAEVRRSLPLLRRAVERAGELGGPAPESSEALIELAARLRYFARVQPRVWEWALWPLRRATVQRSIVLDLVDRWLEAAFGRPSSESESHVEASASRVADARRRVKARERAIASTERLHEGLDARGHAHVLLRHPLDWEGVTSDAELLGDPASRVVDATALGIVRQADAAERELRERVERAWRTERAHFARPWPQPSGEALVEVVAVGARGAVREVALTGAD